MPLELSVELSAHMTWRDLIAFVDAARPHVDLDDSVEVTTLEDYNEWVPDKMTVEIPNMEPTARVIDQSEAQDFRAALQAVIDNDGDARMVLAALTRLRDALG